MRETGGKGTKAAAHDGGMALSTAESGQTAKADGGAN